MIIFALFMEKEEIKKTKLLAVVGISHGLINYIDTKLLLKTGLKENLPAFIRHPS
jgi:hypothetical protein